MTPRIVSTLLLASLSFFIHSVDAADLTLCPPPHIQLQAKAIFSAKASQYRQSIIVNLVGAEVTTDNINAALYDTQITTQAVIDMAGNCQDLALLDQIADIYLAAYPYLRTYVDDGFLRKHESFKDTATNFSGKRWLESKNYTSGGNDDNTLALGQFDYALSKIIYLISSVPAAERSRTMNIFRDNYFPILVNHLRWQVWHTNTWTNWEECRTTSKMAYTDGSPLNKFLNRLIDKDPNLNNGKYSYCLVVTDSMLWWASIGARLFAAELNDPIAFNLRQQGLDEDLRGFLKTSSDLMQKRLTTTQLKRFDNVTYVEGYIFDEGLWRDHPDHSYSGVDSPCFPKLPTSDAAALFSKEAGLQCSGATADPKQSPKTSWDLSHAQRFVQVLNSLEIVRKYTGANFPTVADMEKFANQIAYSVSNRDLVRPMFRNYIDGSNGWYRVNYSNRIGFGYAPWSGTHAYITGGFPLWAAYNEDLKKINERIYQLLIPRNATEITFKEFGLETTFFLEYKRNMERLDFSESQSSLMFLSTYPRLNSYPPYNPSFLPGINNLIFKK